MRGRIPIYKSYDRGPVEFKSKIHKEEGDIMTIARKQIITITPTAPVKDAAQTMVRRGVRRLPVVRTGTKNLEGMLRSRDIVDFLGGGEKHNIIKTKFNGNFYAAMNEPVKIIMIKEFPSGNIYMSIEDAAKLLLKSGFGGVPILDKDEQMQGLVSERDFVAYVPAEVGTSVDYYMVRHVATVGPETPIVEASRRMVSWGVRRLPVVLGRVLVGIITTVDILNYFGTSKVYEYMRSQNMDDVLNVPVQEIMTKEVLKVAPETDVGEAAAIMRERGCGALAVVAGTSLVGIITEHDLLRLLV